MAKSWGHRIAGFDPGTTDAMPEWLTCSGHKCHAKPGYIAQYDYITGRQGRVSFASRNYCEEHARKFCDRYGIDFGQVPLFDYRTIEKNRAAFATAALSTPEEQDA